MRDAKAELLAVEDEADEAIASLVLCTVLCFKIKCLVTIYIRKPAFPAFLAERRC